MINWTASDKYPEDTCRCRCGAVWASHAKFVFDPAPGLVTRRPCPACGRNDQCVSVRGGTEAMSFGAEDVKKDLK